MRNKRKLILLIFIFLIKCSTLDKEKISGRYTLKTEVGEEYFQFNNDSTFVFNCKIPLISSKSNGNWELKDNSIVINSSKQYRNDYIEAEELMKGKDYFIQIINEENEGIFDAGIKFNDNDKLFFTDMNGIIHLEELKKGDLIKINTLGLSLEKGTYIVQNINTTSLKVKVFRKKNEKRYFENNIVKVKKDKIIFNKQVYKKETNQLFEEF